MFSRPVKSGWNPAPSSSNEPTRPSTASCPAEGRNTPAIIRSSVVFPEPFRPMNPTEAPGSIRNETSWTALTMTGFRCRRRMIASFSVTCRCG